MTERLHKKNSCGNVLMRKLSLEEMSKMEIQLSGLGMVEQNNQSKCYQALRTRSGNKSSGMVEIPHNKEMKLPIQQRKKTVNINVFFLQAKNNTINNA